MTDQTAALDQAGEHAATFVSGCRYALAFLTAAATPENFEQIVRQAKEMAANNSWSAEALSAAIINGEASKEIFKDELLARLRRETADHHMKRRLSGEDVDSDRPQE